MPKVTLFNISGNEVGEVELSDSVFGIEPNEHVLHEAALMQRASLRRGTHKVKGRSEVRGGGRKPWKQKVQVALVKAPFVLHNGKAAALSSDQHHVAIPGNCLRRFVVWRSNPLCPRKYSRMTLSYWIA